jgi:hypothetical protein
MFHVRKNKRESGCRRHSLDGKFIDKKEREIHISTPKIAPLYSYMRCGGTDSVISTKLYVQMYILYTWCIQNQIEKSK